MGKHGATKKEINRMKKADMLKFITSHNLPCNKKMSKKDLVACIFKNKGMRSAFVIPEKRKMSEKQMANLNRFKIGGGAHKDFKNEKLIKPKSTYLADLGEVEGKETFKAKSKPHFEEIKQDNRVSAKVEFVRSKELRDSTSKLDDNVKQAISGAETKQNKNRLRSSESQARQRTDPRFGEGAVAPEFDLSLFNDAEGKLDPNKIKRIKADLEKNDPTNPLLKVVVMLEQIANRKEKRGIQNPATDLLDGPDDLLNFSNNEVRAVEELLNDTMPQLNIDADGILSQQEVNEINQAIRDNGGLPDLDADDEEEIKRMVRDFNEKKKVQLRSKL